MDSRPCASGPPLSSSIGQAGPSECQDGYVRALLRLTPTEKLPIYKRERHCGVLESGRGVSHNHSWRSAFTHDKGRYHSFADSTERVEDDRLSLGVGDKRCAAVALKLGLGVGCGPRLASSGSEHQADPPAIA